MLVSSVEWRPKEGLSHKKSRYAVVNRFLVVFRQTKVFLPSPGCSISLLMFYSPLLLILFVLSIVFHPCNQICRIMDEVITFFIKHCVYGTSKVRLSRLLLKAELHRIKEP